MTPITETNPPLTPSPQPPRPKAPPRVQARKSLRSILTLWFLLFSIVPLAFVTGYSLVRFESAIDEELYKRLKGNAREIEVVLTELDQFLVDHGARLAQDTKLIYLLSTSSIPQARRAGTEWIKSSPLHGLSLFDRDGRLVVALYKDGDGDIKSRSNLESGDVYLSDSVLKSLSTQTQSKFRDIRPKTGLELIVYTKLLNAKGMTAGFVEENLVVGDEMLEGLKKRLNLELVIFDKELRPALATNPDFLLYPRNFFQEVIGTKSEGIFEIKARNQPFGFMISKVEGAEPEVFLGLATSKVEVRKVIKGINKTLFSIVGVIVMLLILTLLSASNMVLKPLYRLVGAAQRIEGGEFGTQIPIESETEIGLLTVSFNKMSKRVAEARSELERKIQELEEINRELHQTQAQLVHSSKMVSLGQLVAGVAHELNNPISFIFSNMSHLKDYSDRLIHLVETAEKNPQSLDEEKTKAEFDYIVDDLPRLIRSCEDGARRVRDIVIGLRNFSRLDEFHLKEIDIGESLQNTLNLLSGELKTRIQVHTDLAEVPQVKCYASQINQVFMNLLTNAAQAIEGSGEIWIVTRLQGPYVSIKIRDSGKGIPQEYLDKIFDPFFTTKPVGQGTGLGLSISYGIVKKHEGDLKVKSTPGVGTEFEILLPLKGPTPEVAEKREISDRV